MRWPPVMTQRQMIDTSVANYLAFIKLASVRI
jgi:hypothetical protein